MAIPAYSGEPPFPSAPGRRCLPATDTIILLLSLKTSPLAPAFRQHWSVRCVALFLSVAGLLPLVQADPARPAKDAALAAAAASNPDPLRPGYASAWANQTHPDLSAFDAWTQKFANARAAAVAARTSAAPSAAMLEEGVRLARQRHGAVLKLMRTDPARALSGAVPASVRATLPATVLAELETPFSSLGDFSLTCVMPNKFDRGARPELVRHVKLADGKTYLAHVYGRRLTMTTKRNVFLQGILLDGEAVVDVNTLRALPAAEAAMEKRAPRAVTTSVADVSAAGVPVLAEAGGSVYRFSSAGQMRYTERRLRALEAGRTAETVDAAEDKALLDDKSATAPVASSPYTTGTKKVIVIRVDFSDLPGDPKIFDYVSDFNTCTDVANNQVKPYYVRSSYALTDLTPTISTKIYRMPRSASSYATSGDNDGLHNDAERLARADYDLSTYDRSAVLFTFLGDLPGSQIDYGGLAEVGGPRLWINGEFDFRVVAHELGHTYGLIHANYWQVFDGNPASLDGESVEYGDDFDTMGANFANTQATDFNVWYKTQLDWVEPAKVQTITQTGTYRIHRFDGGSKTDVVALKIVKDSIRNYYVSARRNFTDNQSMTHGVYVSWGYNDTGIQHVVLDMQTPGDDVTDAALPTGASFRDDLAQVTITPIAEGGTAPDEYEDVEIVLGAAINQPIINSPLTATGFINVPFTYQITATNSPFAFGALDLPEGLTIDPTTGIISGIPTTAGTYDIILQATNFGGTGSAQLVLRILDNTSAPTVTSPATTRAFIGVPFTYAITGTNGPSSFSATGLPAGLVLDPATGLITGRTTAAPGTYLVTISAISGAGSGSIALTIYVSTVAIDLSNDNFVNARTLPGAFGSVPGNNEGATKEPNEPFHGFNQGGHSLWYRWVAPADGDVTFDTLGSTFDTLLGVYTGTSVSDLALVEGADLSGSDDAGGSYGMLSRVTFTAEVDRVYYIAVDGSDRSGVRTGAVGLISLQYAQGNDAATPRVMSGTVHGLANARFTYKITATNNPVSFDASGLPPGYTFDAVTGVITGYFLPATGSIFIDLGATNPSGTGTGVLVVTTDPPAPTVNSTLNAFAQVGVPFTYQITATETDGFSVSYNATGLPNGLQVDQFSGVIFGTPLLTGTFNVVISATNVTGTGSATLVLTVNPATPIIKSATAVSGQVGKPFTYQIDANNSPTAYGATGLPPGLSIDMATGLISGVPTAQGLYTVALTAANAGGIGQATVTITIIPAAPVITSLLTATGNQAQPFTYQITATDNPTSFGATGLPGGLTIDPVTGIISGTPTEAGTFQVTLSATNVGGTGTAVLVLKIIPLTPVITSATTATGHVGSPFSYQITATNSPTAFAASGLPNGLSVDTTTGVISGTPTIAGTYTVNLIVTNEGGHVPGGSGADDHAGRPGDFQRRDDAPGRARRGVQLSDHRQQRPVELLGHRVAARPGSERQERCHQRQGHQGGHVFGDPQRHQRRRHGHGQGDHQGDQYADHFLHGSRHDAQPYPAQRGQRGRVARDPFRRRPHEGGDGDLPPQRRQHGRSGLQAAQRFGDHPGGRVERADRGPGV